MPQRGFPPARVKLWHDGPGGRGGTNRLIPAAGPYLLETVLPERDGRWPSPGAVCVQTA